MQMQQEHRRDYVAQAFWLVRRGRTDLVDLVADEFERPTQQAEQVGDADPEPPKVNR
jgi:hypothetical protein